jgi:hypothetical protein
MSVICSRVGKQTENKQAIFTSITYSYGQKHEPLGVFAGLASGEAKLRQRFNDIWEDFNGSMPTFQRALYCVEIK